MSSSKVVAKFSQSYAANNFPDSANEILNDEQETLSDASQMSNSSSEPKSRRWTWNDEKITSLIGCLYEYKVKKDSEGKDIEADLIKFYEDIRQLMARLYPSEDFGMEEIDELPTDADDQEKVRLQKIIAEQKKQIKTGYGRIKSRIKIIRQNFKRAVVAGTRSGSGKIIIQNWDELLKIWGSCPSVKRIDGPVMTKTMNEVESDDSTSNDIPQDNDEEILEEPSAYPKRKARPLDSSDEEESSKPLRLKDKKRSKMEKPLSSRQRDEVILRVAREELELKKKNAEILQNSAKGHGSNGWSDVKIIDCSWTATWKWPCYPSPSNINQSKPTVFCISSHNSISCHLFFHIAIQKHKINFKRIVLHLHPCLVALPRNWRKKNRGMQQVINKEWNTHNRKHIKI